MTLAREIDAYETMLSEVDSRFTNFEFSGQGATGTVFRALDQETAHYVALKVLPPDLCRNEEFLERMRREARALASLWHPNVVRLVHYHCAATISYIAMEFVEGLGLPDHIEKQGRTIRHIVGLIAQAAGGLYAAHRVGILHRDIKPVHIMVSAEGQAKLVDFGLAKLDGAAGGRIITQAGQSLGTYLYMAPETIRHAATTIQTDIYQLGMVLYEALTGVHPFDGMPVAAFLHGLDTLEIPPPSVHGAAVDDRLDAIVLRAVALDPQERYDRAADLARDLLLWLKKQA